MRRSILAGALVALLVSIPALADVTDVLNQVTTGHFWAGDGARINRVTDRLFVGEAALSDGNVSPTGDWLSSAVGWAARDPALMVVPQNGGRIGITAATRTSDGAGIPIAAFAFANSSGQNAMAYYGEGTCSAGALLCYGAELDAIQLGTAVSASPYNISNSVGQALALWLACGGGEVPNVHDCTAALGVGRNGAPFRSGLVFRADALYGNDGTTGSAEAIALPKGDWINWYNPSGNQVLNVGSSISTGPTMQLIFTDYGMMVQQAGSTVLQALSPGTASDTGILLQVNKSGTVSTVRVKIGATNSCGSGKRCLVVDN